jgi:hypothetical protein
MRNRAGIFLVFVATAILAAATASAVPVEVSVSFFHDQLAPHGRWVAAGSYGTCWVPSGVAAGWQPYVDGEWVYSDYGWTWAADDPWGDIPYHYGTWAWVDPYGWVWVPGTVWAPAWVTWAYTDDYVGWAPVPPSFALSATGYFGPPVVVTATRYVFVPTRQFVGVRVATVRVPAPQAAAIIPRAVKTTRFEVAHGVVRVAGPPAASVERAVGRPIPRVAADKLRVRPTSLQAGGVAPAKSIRIVAPEKERARLTTEKAAATSARPAKAAPATAPERRTAEKAEKAQKAKPAKKEPAARAESSPRHEAAPAKRQAEPRETSAQHEPKPNAKPEHRAVEPEKAKATSHNKPKPEPKAKPKDDEPSVRESADVSRTRPEPQAQPRPDSRASINGERAPHPAESKPKEKPKPPKDKERPPKDSPDTHH